VLLILDNRDSFTFNLAQAFSGLGAEVRVESARKLSPRAILALSPERVLIGPGPGRPGPAGPCTDVVRELAGHLPVLGVCLGHQAIATAYGGELVPAAMLRHGGTAPVEHDGKGVFARLANPLTATVYHSLVVDPGSLPPELEISARDEHGDVMGLRHRELPLEGVQFHPEALRTRGGMQLLANFLQVAPKVDTEPGSSPNP